MVWSWDVAAEALQALVPAYEQSHPGRHVTVLNLGNGAVQQRALAGCAAGGKHLPDLLTVQNNRAELFWARFPDQFRDLRELGVEALKPQFPSFAWTPLSRNDRIYGLPWDCGPVVMFYRRDRYAEAGVDPAAIHTWDDWEQACQRLQSRYGGRTHMLVIPNGGEDTLFRTMLAQQGVGYFSADGRAITINSPQAESVMRRVRRWQQKGLLGFGGWSEEIESLKAGQTLHALYGGWYEPVIRTQLPEQSGCWGVYSMPSETEGGRRSANLGGSALCIPASSPRAQEAWKFMTYALASTSSQISMLKQSGLVPAYLPATRDPYLQQPQPFWGGQPIWNTVLRDVDQPMPRGTEYYQEAHHIAATMFSEYLAGRAGSAAECLAQTAELMHQATGLPLAR